PLHHMDQKNFLRLHLDSSGELTVYPIGIDRVARRWEFAPDGAPHEPWLVPAEDGPKPHLIEPPLGFPCPK
ncbi:MAG: hypothetical protein M3314_01850, partial [Actinomycetota bacterium]|nr:hypothetical protein [Actinomycetota bacterium]